METYVEYDICVNGKTWHIVVSEEHDDKTTWAVLTYRNGKVFRCTRNIARCNPADEFDLAIGVKTAVERMHIGLDNLYRPIWHGFRRAQWHKLHDVTDEQMMITHWMPIENVKKQDDDDWISVDKDLPGHGAEFMGRYSVCVEAKFADGHTEKNCWYDYSDGTWERSADVTMNIEYRRDVVAWRPMRGDK